MTSAPTIGVLVNMRARTPRRDPQLVERLRAKLGRESVRATHKLEEVDDALRDFQRRCVETLVLVGGDGTAGLTLTRAAELWATDLLPRVALVGGGTVSTVARSFRARGDPERTIQRLLERTPTEHQRPLVGVRAQGRALLYGMIFAMGGATRFLELYYENGERGTAGAAAVLLRALASSAIGGPLSRRILKAIRTHVEVDGKALDLDTVTLLGASTVRDVGLGFRPFASAGSDPSRIHFLAGNVSGPRLAVELPGLRLGRYARTSSFTHASAARVELRFEAPQAWSLDAELYPPASELEIFAGPSIRFLEP